MLCQRIANWDFGVFFDFTRHQSNRLQSSVVLIQRFILPSLLHSIAMNTVRSLQSRPFSQLTLEEKLEVKRLGPDRPQLYALKPEKHADWLDAILLRYQVATIYAQIIYSEMPVELTFYYDLL